MKKLLIQLQLILLLLAGCASIEQATVSDSPYEPTAPVESTENAPAENAPAEASTPQTSDVDVTTASLDAEIPWDPALKVGELTNGLKYYIRTHQRPEKRAELRLFIRAGSTQEDDDQQGLAHFLEHMAFNGSRHFEKQELVDYLESIGMRFGPDINAYTSFDETVYMLQIPTDDEEIVTKAFLIMEDWAHGVSLEGEEIDKERGVVVEEWRLGRGAQARIQDEQFPLLFQGSRYAERLPIGKKEILETAPHDALRRFYRDWYRPDLMAVVAVGDFDADKIEGLIRQHFTQLENPEEPRPRELFPIPDHEETLWSSLTDPELTMTSVSIYYKLPKPGEGTFGDYRRGLVEGLHTAMLNSRLGELTQKADPPFLFGYASKSSLVASRAVYVQGAAVAEGGVERGLDAVLNEAERVDRHGFTETELERAKTNLRRSYEQAWRERDKAHSSSLASECGRNFLTGEPIPGIGAELELVDRFLPTITLEEVNHLAQSWITEENRVILLSGPEKEDTSLPSKDELLAVFEASKEREVEPWVDEVRDEPLVATAPAPGRVVEESRIEEIGVTEWRLENGIRVILKSTDFRNDQILVHGFSPGGHSLAADEDHTSAIFATTLVDESGYGEFSSIELSKALAGKVASGSTYISELEEGFRGSASPEDLETFFQLLYLSFTAPRFDEEAYRSLLSRLEIVIRNREKSPETVFRDKLTEVTTGNHWRRRPLTTERLAEIDPERSLAIYRERFADASDFTFILVGTLEPDKIRPLVETWIGGLPAAKREENWRDVGVEGPKSIERFEVEKGLEPKSQVRLIYSGPAEWTREATHDIRSLTQVLRLRLREILREDMGGTYGVNVSGSISERPRQEYTVRVSFGCDPKEAEGLIAAVFEEIEKTREEGIEESYLDKVKESLRRGREVNLKENSYWLGALGRYYGYGHDPRWILDVEKESAAVTPERVHAAAERYLDPERYVLGVLYPEEGNAEPSP